ncbi:hypothetical protein K523DRAFT_86874 [Schizophyllum commune Tattone D]|nr:hypothetical protein K523DRAFT_86874 [Schizophyllum commune Tattone D]
MRTKWSEVYCSRRGSRPKERFSNCRLLVLADARIAGLFDTVKHAIVNLCIMMGLFTQPLGPGQHIRRPRTRSPADPAPDVRIQSWDALEEHASPIPLSTPALRILLKSSPDMRLAHLSNDFTSIDPSIGPLNFTLSTTRRHHRNISACVGRLYSPGRLKRMLRSVLPRAVCQGHDTDVHRRHLSLVFFRPPIAERSLLDLRDAFPAVASTDATQSSGSMRPTLSIWGAHALRCCRLAQRWRLLERVGRLVALA